MNYFDAKRITSDASYLKGAKTRLRFRVIRTKLIRRHILNTHLQTGPVLKGAMRNASQFGGLLPYF